MSFISSSIVSGKICIPINDRDFVEQATRPLRDVLCLKPEQCIDYIDILDLDHKGVTQLCKDALANEVKRQGEMKTAHEKASKEYYSKLGLRAIIVVPTTIGGSATLAHITSKAYKTWIGVGAVLGFMLSLFITPSTELPREIGSSEIATLADAERDWIRRKLAQIEPKAKEYDDKIAAVKSVQDFELPENQNNRKTRDFFLVLKAYYERALSPYRRHL